MDLLNMASGFTIFGFEIKFYGITMALSYVLALVICIILCKKKKYGENLPYKLLLIAFPLAVIGGRLGYVLFSGRSWTFLEILDIRSGGLMLYGGVAFAMIGIIVYAAVKKQNVVRYFDLIVPCMVLAQALGRWGNFFNQEAYGVVVNNPSLQWFPFAVFIEADGMWHLATFFYESLWCFITFFVVYFVFLKTEKTGISTCTYLLMYGFERFFVEGMRTDSLYISSIRVSQLISVVMMGIAIGYFIYLIIAKYIDKKHPRLVPEEVYDETSQEIESATKQIEQEQKAQSLDEQTPVLSKKQLKEQKRLEQKAKKEQEKQQKLAEKQKDKLSDKVMPEKAQLAEKSAEITTENQKQDSAENQEPAKDAINTQSEQNVPASTEISQAKADEKVEQPAENKSADTTKQKNSIRDYMIAQRLAHQQCSIKERQEQEKLEKQKQAEQKRKADAELRNKKIKEQLAKQMKDSKNNK